LTTASIIIALDWSLPIETMCVASNFVLGAVLGQKEEQDFLSSILRKPNLK